MHRAGAIREINETAGFKILAHYWTQGQYDIVTIVDAPSGDEILTGLVSVAGAGNMVSETLRTFTDEEMQCAIGP